VSDEPRTGTVTDDGDGSVDRADRWQERLAIPVLVAALASVPAIFLTLFDDPYETVGSTVNMISGGVLVAEAVVLLAVSQHRLTWLRNNLWLVGLAVVMIPAVVFAVGPVQLLRLLRVFGALRIIRVRRIFKAGQILRRRAGLNRWWQRVVGFVISGLVAAFVAMLLADPSSESRQLLETAVDRFGWAGVVAAGLVLAGSTWVVLRYRDDDGREATAGPGDRSGATAPDGGRDGSPHEAGGTPEG
jgi:CsoR family transcriptional regulator, copper-sensing transcriptional repressor